MAQRGRFCKTLGEKIRHLREKVTMNQDELAEKTKVGGRLISRYENDKTVPSTEVIKRMAEVFGVTADYLICSDGENKGIVRDRELFNQMSIVDKMPEEDKDFVKRLLRALIVDNRLKDVIHPKFQ